MAIENMIGTEYNDWLDGGEGENRYEGDGGDDWINGTTGVNSIVYNLGDGVDTISYAPPRAYQFAGFLEEAQRALDNDLGPSVTGYSNSYFAQADSSLYARLPAEIRDVLNGFRDQFVDNVGMQPGTVNAQAARDAFNALVAWVNTPVSNVIELGPGIQLSDLTVQASALSSFDAPATFSVSVGGDQGVVFNMVPPDTAAATAMPSDPPPIDITFRFSDGTTATLAQVLAQSDGGVAGFQYGLEDAEFMSGSLADDQIYGNGGDDRIDSRAGMDSIYGGAGNDVIAGGAGSDMIYGDEGDDVIAAGRDGGVVGGGAGNDVYLFNLGDGALFMDNTPGIEGGETDTLSFGKDISPQSVVAYVDQFGTLTLAVQGTSDQVLINWFMNNYDGTYSVRPDQIVPRVQFVDANGEARVFDLASLVTDQRSQLLGATLDQPVHLFGSASQYELTGVPVAGGEYATRYAMTGNMFETAPAGNQSPVAGTPLAPQTAVEGQPLSISLPAGAFSDPDGGALTYSASLADGSGLPAWLQFNSQIGELTGHAG